MRDGIFLKKVPSSNSPVRIVNLDTEPSRTISATGIGGCFLSGY